MYVLDKILLPIIEEFEVSNDIDYLLELYIKPINFIKTFDKKNIDTIFLYIKNQLVSINLQLEKEGIQINLIEEYTNFNDPVLTIKTTNSIRRIIKEDRINEFEDELLEEWFQEEYESIILTRIKLTVDFIRLLRIFYKPVV